MDGHNIRLKFLTNITITITMVQVKIYHGYWNEYYVNTHPYAAFIFGDNFMKAGKGGQAMIRFCNNAYGIPTKKMPNNSFNAFMTDRELSINKEFIKMACNKIIANSFQYKYIYLPEDGLGTGLANLKNTAPMTFMFLNNEIRRMIYTLGGNPSIWRY